MDAELAVAPRTIRRPIMTQHWRSLTFLHWPYSPAFVQQLLPPGLQVDQFDGRAWIGLVPFVLCDLRWLGTPAFPWISQFPETNVRTYVRGPERKPGVWFFTLEASRLLAVLGARWLYHLPYRWASMQVSHDGSRLMYRSKRLPPFGGGSCEIEIEAGSSVESAAFEHFVTARFRLYAAARNRVFAADIEHQPWSLRRARLLHLRENLIEACGLAAPQGRPEIHFADEMFVKVDRVRRCGLAGG